MRSFKLTVVMYHYVRDPGDRCAGAAGIPGLGVAQFDAHVARLAREHDLISWPDLRAFLVDDRPLPASACLLTFDDGVLDHYFNVFPILRARGVSGLFFALARPDDRALTLAHTLHFLLPVLTTPGLREAVWGRLTAAQQARFQLAERRYQTQFQTGAPDDPTNVLKAVLQREFAAEAAPLLRELFARHVGDEAAAARDYYLSRAQIAAMAAGGMHFGGHSRTHPWFDWISSAAQAEEIAASAAWLREVEAGPWAFAYPYGGFSAQSPELLRAHGFAAAFTTRAQAAHLEPYFIGRFDGEELVEAGRVAELRRESSDA